MWALAPSSAVTNVHLLHCLTSGRLLSPCRSQTLIPCPHGSILSAAFDLVWTGKRGMSQLKWHQWEGFAGFKSLLFGLLTVGLPEATELLCGTKVETACPNNDTFKASKDIELSWSFGLISQCPMGSHALRMRWHTMAWWHSDTQYLKKKKKKDMIKLVGEILKQIFEHLDQRVRFLFESEGRLLTCLHKQSLHFGLHLQIGGSEGEMCTITGSSVWSRLNHRLDQKSYKDKSGWLVELNQPNQFATNIHFAWWVCLGLFSVRLEL